MPTSEVIQQDHSGQDAVTGLKGRITPTSLLNGHPPRSCVHGMQLRGSRLHTPPKGSQASRTDASGGATPASATGTGSNTVRNVTSAQAQMGSGLHPVCQPMPVQMLVHLMDTLTTQRAPAQDSRAILSALNDYIGDVISQPGPASTAEHRDHFDSTSDFPVFAKPAPPVSQNGATTGGHMQFPTSVQKGASSSESGVATGKPCGMTFAAEPSEVKRMAVAGATATATSPESTAAAASNAVAAAEASTATLQEHILRWSADLGILQALHANGYTETEVENFVNKLLPGLADGVANQLSQSVNGTSATSKPEPHATAASSLPNGSAVSGTAAPAAKGWLLPPPLPQNGTNTSPASAREPSSADSQSGAPSGKPQVTPPAAADAPGVLLTDKVSPFIQHPYHLLQQLHASARKRANSAESTSPPAATASGHAEEPPPRFSKLSAPNGLQPVSAAPHQSMGPPSTPALHASSLAAATAEATAVSAAHASTSQVDSGAGDSVAGTVVPDASETGESTSTRSTSEVLPGAQAQALATVCSMGSSSGDGSAAGSSTPQPIGWKSVLEKLIHAGPQAVQPVSPYVPGSYGWGSGNSSTEHDTFSAKSEDAPPADAAAGTAGASSAGGNTSSAAAANGGGNGKAKKRRNKRSKNSGRSGS